jgi:hypothetical protein
LAFALLALQSITSLECFVSRLPLFSAVLVATCAGCVCGVPSTVPDGGKPGDDAGTLDAGSDGGTETVAQLVSLKVTPENLTLVIDGTTPASQSYTATGQYFDGHTEDVTNKVSFRLENSAMGSFKGPAFTSSLDQGGTTRVVAQVGPIWADTGLTLKLVKRTVDASSNTPPDAPQKFSGAEDATKAPDIVYPNDGVLLPPNLLRLEVHFEPGPNTLFELAFTNAQTDVKVYLRCTPVAGGCIYKPDATLWAWLAETNRGGDPVEMTLRGTDDAGSYVATSSSVRVAFAYENLAGGLYYWTTSAGTGIMRFDFGSTSASAERFIGTEFTGGTCVGCHALSRDGKKIVAEAGGQNDGRVLLMDVGSKTPLVPFAQPQKSIFESWNPDGTEYVGVYGDVGATNFNLMILDGNTGALKETLDKTGTSTNPANHPDWSLEGDKIAFTRVGIHNTLQRMYRGSIYMVSRAELSWSSPQEIVPAQDGLNRYYPSFAPGGDFLVFNESTCPSGVQHVDCDADTDPTAQLFAVRSAAGSTPIHLARANAPGKKDAGKTALTNSFPKWNPFMFRRLKAKSDSKVLWLTFSSTRQYGLRSPVGAGTLLWMVAVDPDAFERGEDPSYAAFALPFQDLETSNHIAQWATEVVSFIEN